VRKCFKHKVCFAFQYAKKGRHPAEMPQKHTEKESHKTANLPVRGNVSKCYISEGKFVLRVPSVYDKKELTGRKNRK